MKPDENFTETRVKDANAARTVYGRMHKDNEKRALTMSQVRNQLEGGRPFDPDQLERDGSAWQTNINFGDAAAAFDRTYLPYWKMVHDVPRKLALNVHTRSPDADKWGVAMSEAFDLFLDDWGVSYFMNFMLWSQDFAKFGPGYVMWEDKYSPRYKHVRTEHMLFPKRARSNPDEWEAVGLSREMTASELYGKIRTGKIERRARDAGWNAAEIKRLLAAHKSDNGDSVTADDYVRMQDELVNNDLAFSCDFAPIEAAYLWVKEYSGGVTCHIFDRSGSRNEFLYHSSSHSDSFRHIFGPIFYTPGVGGLIHSIKGFGIKNYYFSMLSNRMKSRLMDAATLGLSINWQRTEDAPDEAPPVENYGPVNIFPRGLTQMNVYPQIQQGQAVVETLERNQAENNALYREQRKQISDTETATQAQLLAAMAGEVSEATASIYLTQVGENHFAECFRRLRMKGSRDPDAAKFVRRCVERGVPEKIIYGAEISVRTGASPGTASAAIRDMIFRELLTMSNMPGVNRRWVLENYVANKLGAQAISRALLPVGENSDPQSRKMAILENNALGSGTTMPVDPAEAHVEHIEEHLAPLERIAKAYSQSQQIEPKYMVALAAALPHTQQHFEYLKQDETRKTEYRALWARFSAVSSVARGMFAAADGGPNG